MFRRCASLLPYLLRPVRAFTTNASLSSLSSSMSARAPSALLSTEALHAAAPSASSTFEGPYAASRARLDYTWHGRYTPARQRLQDGLIAGVLASGRAAPRPWLVHTAGAMGAGKSHVIRELARARAFPLAAFVWIDPDVFKSSLPETPELIRADPERASSLLHKESVHIAEIAEREALARGLNVLVDGSLQNTAWYAHKFAAMRSEYPAYRLAIVHVTASRETIFSRAAARATKTGRFVPPALLDDVLARVPASVAALSPLVDYTAQVANEDDGTGPTVCAPATTESFKAVWADIWNELYDERDELGGDPVDPTKALARNPD